METSPSGERARADEAEPDGCIREPAPAKVNLALHVVGRRADGYHLLETVVTFTDFGDEVTVRHAEADAMEVVGPTATAIHGSNIAERARDMLRAAIGGAPPVHICIGKRIPVEAGLGGGSADAAAVLRALARLWNADVTPDTLARIALKLGADVPMCLASRPLIARGAGERLTPLPRLVLEGHALVLVNPGAAVPTPAVFAALRERSNPALPDWEEAEDALRWLARTRNDLLVPALTIAPVIGEALAALDGCEFSRMSGSGATCFGIYSSLAEADRAAARIRARYPDWFVVSTRFTEPEEPA